MATFSQFLNSFEPETKGRQFEIFVKWFLKNDPEWSTQVDQIWLWNEYPDRWGPDCGIDLVFKHKNSEIWAVQAKCYSQEYSISKKDVDTFLSESNRTEIDKRLLIASTDLIGANARRTCANQEKDVVHFLYSDFEKAAIEYPANFSKLSSTKRKAPPTHRPHQSEALDAVEKGFTENDRGQLLMACGTGKTYTTLWIKERIKAQSTLVLVPSLSLLSQTLREWTFAANESFEVLCVCSDETVGKKSGHDEIIQSVHDLSFPVTSNVDEIKDFLQGKDSKVIFSTYQSSPIIAQAQSEYKAKIFDLVIADEAHRCTGEAGSAFTTVLDDTLIKARRRLFATATPKTYTANLKKIAEERGVEITGMDDEAVFGKVFYYLPFGEAIKRELLTDYQVVIIGVDQPMITEWIENRELIKTASGEATDAESLAAQIGLFKAIKDYDLKRIISFHSRVKRAETFASDIQNSIDFISKKQKPKGTVWTDFVSGKMSTHKRKTKLDQLKELSQGERGLLSNARCLFEGVDVPSLDGVAFIDPKGSQVDIIQAVGRAIRLSQEKTVGTIFLPVFIQDGDDAESSIQSSNFKPVWNVLNALKSHDDVLAVELDQLRTNLGRKHFQGKIKGIPKVIIDLPQTVDKSFADSLKTVLVEKTTASWNFWFGLLEDYFQHEGNVNVPTLYKTSIGYKLGSWVVVQRSRKKSLSKEKISRLNSLGFNWEPIESLWELGFKHLEKFIKLKSHALVVRNYYTDDGYNLGQWVGVQRWNNNKNKLDPEKKERLNTLGFIWSPEDLNKEKAFMYLKNFVAEKGHARVAQGFKVDNDFALGSWVLNQRQKRTKNKLSDKDINRLNELNFDWDPYEKDWEEGFFHLKEFFDEKGHLLVPAKYFSLDGYALGGWVYHQRSYMLELSLERKSKLESLAGWVWDLLEFKWEYSFNSLKQFVEKEGHARPAQNYKTEDGYKLGAWVAVQRSKKSKMIKNRKLKLESLPRWSWNTLSDAWEDGFNSLKQFAEKEGHARPAQNYKTDDGYNLGAWVSRQRGEKNEISQKKRKLLESLPSWSWDENSDAWEDGFNSLKQFAEKEGHSRPAPNHKTDDGYNLGSWVAVQRSKKNRLEKKLGNKLDSLPGWSWNPTEDKWWIGLKNLEIFIKENGTSIIPNEFINDEGYKLGQWVRIQRNYKNKMVKKRKLILEELPFWSWNVIEDAWNEGFEHLKKFKRINGNLDFTQTYKTVDGFKLGLWVCVQRMGKNNLSKGNKKQLDELGFVWDKLDYVWETGFKHMKEFSNKYKHIRVSREYRPEDGFRLESWAVRQRYALKKGDLSEEKTSKLESIPGWSWDLKEQTWNEGLTHLTEFSKKFGKCKIKTGYVTMNGFKLSDWVSRQRTFKNELPQEKINQLESIKGWYWVPEKDYWEEGIKNLQEFAKSEGSARPKAKYKTKDGFQLGMFVSNLRARREQNTIEMEQILESIPGWSWEPLEDAWNEGFNHLMEFKRINGHLDFTQTYKTVDGFKLGQWVGVQRNSKNKMNNERKNKLDLLNFIWNILDQKWEKGFSHLKTFLENKFTEEISANYISEDGYRLGAWVQGQRQKKDTLPEERKSRLESLVGWVWDGRSLYLETKWDEELSYLIKFYESEGHANVDSKLITDGGFQLGAWVKRQRLNKNTLNPLRKSKLDALGFVWKVKQ